MDQIVYASTAYTDLKSTVNQQANRLVDFSQPAGGPADERLREAVRLLRPWDVAARPMIRVGGHHDGGYLMVDDFAELGGAVSIGIGPDVSWDADVARRGIPVAMFDPTVRRLPSKVPNGVFHRVGICGSHDVSDDFKPLAGLVSLADFDPGAELLLKMDVEGAEWSALSSLAEAELLPYRQIATELHDLSRLAVAATANDVLASLRLLSVTHIPIHVHANNYSRLLRFDQDWFPDAVEVTYLRRDLAIGAEPATRVSSHLDVACDQRVEEIDLEGLLDIGSG